MNTKVKKTKFINPYRHSTGRWVRGNFHTHCRENSGCGTVPLEQVIRQYHQIGARFLAMSDHNTVTDLTDFKKQYPDMVFFEGFEHSLQEHMLFVGPSVPPLYEFPLEEATRRAGDLLTILCHPQTRRSEDYWTKEKIFALGQVPNGMEIYDGHYGVPQKLSEGRTPQYTHVWDSFLTAGLRLWGFASDDFHDPEDFNNAYNMVLVDEVTPEAILRAVKSGCFYATTGLLLDRIETIENTIRVTLPERSTGRFIGPYGEILAEETGRQFEYSVSDEAFVRFEAGTERGKLFLQPMFRK